MRTIKKTKFQYKKEFLFLVFSLVLSIFSIYRILSLENIIRDLFYFPVALFWEEKEDFQEVFESELESENAELRGLLNLTDTYEEFSLVNATVIARNSDGWNNYLVINKGKRDGVSSDMAVVASGGLIGKTEKITYTTSTVSLLSNTITQNKISVQIKNKKGKMNGLLELDSSNNLVVTGIDKNFEVKQGDSIITSGLSDIFPGSIYIGKVKEVSRDTYDISQVAQIELGTSLSHIRYVAVLKKGE